MSFQPLTHAGNWVRAYVGNASSVRDFRSQLRGYRAFWLWTSYLGILIFVTAVVYSMNISSGRRSIVEIQSELKQFYTVLMTMLGGLVCLVTPAMSATAVVAERQRHSLDLVFSAPVEPSYYLLGKMLSCFRYTWMLLILSLPVASVAIVMGGASWGDLLASFVMLSMIGLLFAAIGLLISTLSTNMISAIIYSYLAVGAYSLFTSLLGSLGSISSFMGSTQEMTFTAGMSPFTVGIAAPSHSTWFGKEIPNWIIVSIVCLLITKTLVMAAASILSHYKSRNTRAFRAWSLGFLVLLFALVIGTFSLPAFGGSMSTSHVNGLIVGYLWVIMTFFLMPHLMAYGEESERRYLFDGDFDFKAAFNGTPAGALPYVLMQWLAMVVGAILGTYLLQSSWPNNYFWLASVWVLGLTYMYWCIGRWTSELARSLRTSRVGVFMASIVIFVLPVPILLIIQTNLANYDSGVWTVHLMYPLSTTQNMELAWIYALIMAAIGTVLYRIAVSRRKLKADKTPLSPPVMPPTPGFEV